MLLKFGSQIRSQYLSHMMPNLGGVVDKVTVVHNLNLMHILLAPRKKGKYPKMTSCGPLQL